MKMKRIVALLFVLVSIFSMVVSAQAAYSTMYVNCDVGETVRLRASASSTGTILTNIPRGTAVQAEYYNSSWHRVTYGNYSGFMMSSFLSSTPPSASSGEVGVTWVSMLVDQGDTYNTRMYSSMNDSSSVVYSFSSAVTVSACFDTGDVKWARCRYNGYEGYIKYIDLDPTETQFLRALYGGTSVNLQRGQTGQAVANLQDHLTHIGYSTNGSDGVFGPNTERAVREFQEDNNLTVDGIAGPNTQKKIFDLLDYYMY